MEMYDICGLFAPKPMLVIAGKDDPIFPLAGVKEAFERLAEIYEAFGARENLELYVGDGGHHYYAARVWPFLEEKLRSGEGTKPGTVIHMRPHHFVDILRQIGAGQEFKPSAYGHAVHSVAKALIENPNTVMMLVNHCDTICAPCVHKKNGVCDDVLSDGKTSKHEFNTALDARLFERLRLEEAMALSAADFCKLLCERFGNPSEIWTNVSWVEAQKRLETTLKGIEKFLRC